MADTLHERLSMSMPVRHGARLLAPAVITAARLAGGCVANGSKPSAAVAKTDLATTLQADLVTVFKRAHALRGGWYVSRGKRVALAGARVVRDASASGELVPTKNQITGTLRLTGRGIADGTLRVQLTTKGQGLATGTLGGRPVHLTFQLGG